MSRVSTLGNYQSALLNLFAAQSRQQDAQQRLSTEKIATDLGGFGRGSETLTALKGAQSRIQGFIDTGETVLARLDSQDLALTRIDDAIRAARTAIAETLAADSAIVLNLELESAFQSARDGLNARHHGNHLFSGGISGEAPVEVDSLAELAAVGAPDIGAAFRNGSLRQTSRVAETSTFETGHLANEIGGGVFEILRDIKIFNDTNPEGPIAGRPTAAQKTFLSEQLGRLDAASRGVVDRIARNGSLQNRVEAVKESNAAQVRSLEEMVGDRTNADLAQAVTDIQLSGVAIQASAQVINQLRQVSLLNFLT